MAQNTPAPITDGRAIQLCLEYRELLTSQELDFVVSLLWQAWRRTPKEQSEFDRLIDKCCDAAAADVA